MEEHRTPPDARLYRVEEERDARIVDWRATCFSSLGFTELNANALAVRRDVDRVQVEALLNAGASHVQVMAIAL